jgi:hypothetical protein
MYRKIFSLQLNNLIEEFHVLNIVYSRAKTGKPHP